MNWLDFEVRSKVKVTATPNMLKNPSLGPFCQHRALHNDSLNDLNDFNWWFLQFWQHDVKVKGQGRDHTKRDKKAKAYTVLGFLLALSSNLNLYL